MDTIFQIILNVVFRKELDNIKNMLKASLPSIGERKLFMCNNITRLYSLTKPSYFLALWPASAVPAHYVPIFQYIILPSLFYHNLFHSYSNSNLHISTVGV